MSAYSPNASTGFAALGLSPGAQETLAALGYHQPTPIQVLAIPPLLAGRDLIGQSRTGSGKTIAFALPLIERLEQQLGLQALVLCPTRDLCGQVAAVLRQLGRHHPHLQVLSITGGRPYAAQARALGGAAQVVVATPGRLGEHLRRGSVSLKRLRVLVLDEADRMLDMGFRDQVDELLHQAPGRHQTALFSATFASEILALSARYQRDPVRVHEPAPAADIAQWRLEVTPQTRLPVLLKVLSQYAEGASLVFCNTKQDVDDLTSALRRGGIRAAALHGDLDQRERDVALVQLRNGSHRVLVATDVAARGLDIQAVGAVVNYAVPEQPETYLHRIGRTGRAGRSGDAVTLHTADETLALREFETLTGCPLLPFRAALAPPAPAPALRTVCIGAGRKDKLRPGDILGALTGAAQLDADQVGRIEIGERLSYVAVPAERAPFLLRRLRDVGIKGRRPRIELLR